MPILTYVTYILGHIQSKKGQNWTKKDNCWFNVILVTFIKMNIKDENFISIYLLDRKEGGYMLLYIVCVTWHHFTQVVNGTSQGFPFQWKIFHHCVKGIWIIRSVLVSFYFAKELKYNTLLANKISKILNNDNDIIISDMMLFFLGLCEECRRMKIYFVSN